MENLITITPEKNAAGKKFLKVELTIDGATKLIELNEQNIALDIHDFYTNADFESYQFRENSIFTTQEIGWDAPQVVLEFTTTTKNIFSVWLNDPKEVIIYEADPQNAERSKEVTAKLAAGMWAVYCNQKLCNALFETNERYNTLKVFYEKMMEAAKSLKYNNFKQDDKYYEIIKNCLTETEKEMDFHLQKVNLMRAVSKNDYYSVTPVNESYRSFRGINEVENKSKINVTSDVDKDTFNSSNNDKIDNGAQQVVPEEIPEEIPEETKRINDSEGESRLRVV